MTLPQAGPPLSQQPTGVRLSAIDGRRKSAEAAPASPGDFVMRDLGPFSPERLLDDPTFSIYCLDIEKRSALFVRTPSDVDLSRAPFMYVAQYESAIEAVSVPFEQLHELAASAPPLAAERLVLVQSTGRCGSTLVSHALSACDGVVAFSEPDVYYQLHQLRDRGDPELGELVASCTTLLFCTRPARAWAVKSRAENIELTEVLLEAFPGAQVIFLYRQTESWARSAARAYGTFRPARMADSGAKSSAFPPLGSLVDYPPTGTVVPPAGKLVWKWATAMARAVALQGAGVPMFIARYEDLSTQPYEVLKALLAYCGLPCAPAQLADVIGRDSQEGTSYARAKAELSGSELTEERRIELLHWLGEMAPGLSPDMLLPGTYGT